MVLRSSRSRWGLLLASWLLRHGAAFAPAAGRVWGLKGGSGAHGKCADSRRRAVPASGHRHREGGVAGSLRSNASRSRRPSRRIASTGSRQHESGRPSASEHLRALEYTGVQPGTLAFVGRNNQSGRRALSLGFLVNAGSWVAEVVHASLREATQLHAILDAFWTRFASDSQSEVGPFPGQIPTPAKELGRVMDTLDRSRRAAIAAA